MKILNSILLRGAVAIIIGLIFLACPESSVNTLITLIGVCLVLFGLFSSISYLIARKEEGKNLVVSLIFGIVSIILGVLFITMPHFFVTIFMYIFGALLVLGGLTQFLSLYTIRHTKGLSSWFFLIPVLVVIMGVVVLCNPYTAASVIFILIGVTMLLYGLQDIVSWYKFRNLLR